AVIDFTLPASLVGREQDNGDARFALDVTVTDSARQKQSKSVARIVTSNPIHLEVIAENSRLVWGESNTIFVYASYGDGRPAHVRLAVTGLERELTTSSLGVTSFQIKPETSEVELSLRATDDQGRVGRRTALIKCHEVLNDFIIRTDRAVYDAGETVRLTALGPGGQPVFVDLLKDGQTILTRSVEMRHGKGGL